VARRCRRPDLRAPKVPHIAVPTTLSGAEFTAVAGITDPVVGEKQMYLDPQLLPAGVRLRQRAGRDLSGRSGRERA